MAIDVGALCALTIQELLALALALAYDIPVGREIHFFLKLFYASLFWVADSGSLKAQRNEFSNGT